MAGHLTDEQRGEVDNMLRLQLTSFRIEMGTAIDAGKEAMQTLHGQVMHLHSEATQAEARITAQVDLVNQTRGLVEQKILEVEARMDAHEKFSVKVDEKAAALKDEIDKTATKLKGDLDYTTAGPGRPTTSSPTLSRGLSSTPRTLRRQWPR